MTPFRWVLLCILFTLYLLFGGSIFMLIEQHHEIHQKEELHVLRQDIQEILFRLDHNFYNNGTSPDVLDALTSAKESVINRIASVCGIDDLLEDTGQSESNTLKWNYYNSVFFAFTVVTTIGYGHLSPSTNLSKSFMMLYALFGIPINGILLSGVGDYFSNKLVKVHQKSKQKKYRGKCTLIFEIVFYLIPGIVVFIIIPAGVFVLIENWTFLDSVYFAFVSLTTIGFGDYVAGMGDGHNIWLWLYKAFIIIWITFGLGYLIMILGFIAKGLKSKKVRGVLEKRLTGIRHTKDKLSKEIDYMRHIVNELYLMKIKPTYDMSELEAQAQGITEDSTDNNASSQRRCNSMPNISQHGQDADEDDVFEIIPGQNPSPNPGRGVHIKSFKISRRLSESDMSHVHRDRAFLNLRRDAVTPAELLSAVMSELSGNMQNVMNAVEELNQLERQVVDGHESPEDENSDHERRRDVDVESISSDDDISQKGYPGSLPPWDLNAVEESDEEILLDEDGIDGKLESVMVHKIEECEKKGSQSLLEKVSGAIRKISSNTPPETPSRKISRNDSDKKRKISRMDPPEKSILQVPMQSHMFRRYSSFTRRPSHLPRLHPTETENIHSMYRKGSADLRVRKISQESRISNASNSSYKTIDEIMKSAKTRKITPMQQPPYTPSLPPEDDDQFDTDGNVCAETSSLAHFLRALDNVQDRLKKTSDVSCSGSYFSDHSDVADLSNSFAPSSTSTPISSSTRRYRRSGTPPESADRRRKVGVFQPGFSYVNFGFNPEEDSNSGTSQGKDKNPPDEFSNNNNPENHTSKRR